MPTPTTQSYTILLRQVKATLIDGQKRIEQEKVRTYWETGRIIHEDILKNKDRGEYGAEIVKRLAADLNIHLRVLQRCVQFAKTYPNLEKVARGPLLSWSHYRELISIPDKKKRASFESALIKNQWTRDELLARIKQERPILKIDHRPSLGKSESINQKPLTPLRGTPFTYKLVKRPMLGLGEHETDLLVDLGFGVFHEVEQRLLAGLSEDEIIESREKDDAYKFSKSERTAKDLYTYRAFVERVVDGDTLKVRFDLGFGIWMRETLRLRGIDCPEMDTKEGQAAKTFVQSWIKDAQEIVVRSSRSDKYDRYLADIFVSQGEDLETEIYLNNLLLEHGHARRVEW